MMLAQTIVAIKSGLCQTIAVIEGGLCHPCRPQATQRCAGKSAESRIKSTFVVFTNPLSRQFLHGSSIVLSFAELVLPRYAGKCRRQPVGSIGFPHRAVDCLSSDIDSYAGYRPSSSVFVALRRCCRAGPIVAAMFGLQL